MSGATIGQHIRQRFFRDRAEDNLPIVLRHERIYILPSRRGGAFLLVLLMMLLASVNYNLNLGFALCFLLAGLFASTLLGAFQNISGLEIRRITSTDVFAGNPLRFDMVVSETHRRNRYSIKIGSHTTSTTIDLSSESPVHATLLTKALPRGEHPIGRLTISSTYPMGLSTCWCYVHTISRGCVYPSPETPTPPFQESITATRDKSAAVQSQARNEGTTQTSGSEGEPDGLRLYQKTDSAARIAWKAVARGHGLVSKSVTGMQAHQGVIKISWDALPSTLSLEQRLSRVCSWALEADEKAIPFAVALPGLYSTAKTGKTHRNEILRYLARFEHQPSATGLVADSTVSS